ncbi:hypothetical protein PBY51_014658 [Eleginops maclovinus]|uniref:Uncharacterized protein n=1 Tax=Eleginops maclovinus TaxID=56733 RepID=A0AAN8AFX0_ELEMC|nr:hypothetical protein PBY51_014658 [Eleginops maclovinus]
MLGSGPNQGAIYISQIQAQLSSSGIIATWLRAESVLLLELVGNIRIRVCSSGSDICPSAPSSVWTL